MIANMNGGFNPSGTINITNNGSYNVKDYATANVNVQSAPVLLWTNPDSSVGFAAQTINVSGGYSAFIIECKSRTTDNQQLGKAFFNIGSTGVVSPTSPESSEYYSYFREVMSTTSTSIEFGTGGYFHSGTGRHTNFTYAVPTRIWGVKFTL